MSRCSTHMGLVFMGFSLVLAAAGCGEPSVVQATAVEHGEMLFHDSTIAGTSLNSYACATCHEAEPGEAKDRILPGSPLAGATERPSYWGGSELSLLRSLNHCAYYFMLKDAAFTKEDETARALYAYLESLPSGEKDIANQPFAVVYLVDDVPEGSATAGAALFERACSSCHGAAHTGEGRLVERAPVLPEQTIEEHPSPTYTDLDRRLVFIEKVRHGAFVGYGGQMPPFSVEKLPDQDLADVLAFLGL